MKQQIQDTRPKRWVIHTASGTVPLCVYVESWRNAKTAKPGTEYKSSLATWWPVTREELLKQFSEAVHQRINAYVPWYRIGRKWSDGWQISALVAAREVNTPRLRVHWLPLEFRNRLTHRLATFND